MSVGLRPGVGGHGAEAGFDLASGSRCGRVRLDDVLAARLPAWAADGTGTYIGRKGGLSYTLTSRDDT